MPSQPPLPPLLAPYLTTQPEASLTLVSSILGATSNWLVLRFLHASLNTSLNLNASLGLGESHNGFKKRVVLVSFLRGWEFWRAEAKRLVCIDRLALPGED
jgi:elongator complex protein 6